MGVPNGFASDGGAMRGEDGVTSLNDAAETTADPVKGLGFAPSR
jgi:hypothetical protein